MIHPVPLSLASLITAFDAGIVYGMKTTAQKFTVHIQKDLMRRAQRASRAGVTETIRKGLQLLAARDAYDQLLKMEGKLKVSINLDELREDRS